jgi:hypothetical protein
MAGREGFRTARGSLRDCTRAPRSLHLTDRIRKAPFMEEQPEQAVSLIVKFLKGE